MHWKQRNCTVKRPSYFNKDITVKSLKFHKQLEELLILISKCETLGYVFTTWFIPVTELTQIQSSPWLPMLLHLLEVSTSSHPCTGVPGNNVSISCGRKCHFFLSSRIVGRALELWPLQGWQFHSWLLHTKPSNLVHNLGKSTWRIDHGTSCINDRRAGSKFR